MVRAATSRLKVNPPLGVLPALQYLLPAQLAVDPAYQRSIEGGDSQALIRKIAMFWNWDLCQPLVVARREDGGLYVIDGQHRLEAARLRGDIAQLPAVVVQYASAADEAASFVHLNQQRRPLTRIDLFKAAVASGDGEACAIVAALAEVGLTVAPHGNFVSWKPGMISNIGGIESAWRRHGAGVTTTALRVLAQAFAGQVLQYAGTLFPGIAAVCADEMKRTSFAHDRFERFVLMIGKRRQIDWRGDVLRAKVADPNLNFIKSSEVVLRAAWDRANGVEPVPLIVAASMPQASGGGGARPAVVPSPVALETFAGKRWCDQCEMNVTHAQGAGCKSRWCSLRAFG